MPSSIFFVVLGLNALLFAFATASVASYRGHNVVMAFILGFIFGPFGLVIACFRPVNLSATQAPVVEAGPMRLCESCRSYVPDLASVCRFCGRDLPDEDQIALGN